MILTIVLFVAVLGFLVFVHEGGHFLAANSLGAHRGIMNILADWQPQGDD